MRKGLINIIRHDYKKESLLMFFPFMNLLFMHYYFYVNNFIEWTWLYSKVINLCAITFDVSVMFLLCLLVVKRNMKLALLMIQVVTLAWAFVNVVYGRFFFQYLPLSVIQETSGLGNSLVINSILPEFHWYDSYFIFTSICFFLIYKKTTDRRIDIKVMVRLIVIPLMSVVISIVAYSAYHFAHPRYRNNSDLYFFRIKELLYDSSCGGTPNLAHFQTGSLRVACFEIYDLLKTTNLTSKEKKEINDVATDYSLRTTHHPRNPEIRNVIFVLLESFLSEPIGLVVDGKEITPFLNQLKREENVFYNGYMKSDIGCGESGDGQFIYMNGILPLKTQMTIGQIKDKALPSLPKLLQKTWKNCRTEIYFPTSPNLWQQAHMNHVYGIDYSYSIEDIKDGKDGDVDDEMIFDFVSKSLNKNDVPFFSLILSLSTHSPYDKYHGEDYLAGNKTLPVEYKNYLNTCHYTDSQLRKFFDTIKQKGLYHQSLIVIASDHYAHVDMLKMQGKLSDRTPLFIVNGDIDKQSAWGKDFHQIDVFTTLLDILNIDSKWKGLGHTLLNPHYKSSVDATSYRVSEWIINGDYFPSRK